MGTTKRKMNPNSLKNLKTAEEVKEYNRRNADETKARCSKGGKNSAQKKKDMRTLREITLEILAAEARPEVLEQYNLPEGTSNAVAMIAAAAVKAQAGDVRAQEYLRDTAGQMPTKEVQVSAEVFTEANKALLDKVADRIKKQEE